MIISDTSALVLNWTSKDIWKSRAALDYFSSLDLSAADALLDLFDEREHFMHTQAVSNRKYFMRKRAIEFLEECSVAGIPGQVIILAAGIAPLSVEIASLYPDSIVFDVDKYLMEEKEAHLGNSCPNIRFVSCDIADTALLEETLQKKGWEGGKPGLLIMEGIIYYLNETDLISVLKLFSGHQHQLACDFGLRPEYVQERNRGYGIDLFRKIQDLVGLAAINLYEPEYFMNLLQHCGFKDPQRSTMGDIQDERTSARAPFEGDEPGWISVAGNQTVMNPA